MDEQAGRSADVVSVGVVIDNRTHLHKINQWDSLEQVIETLKKNLFLPVDKKYALQFDKRNVFITEQNRHEIKDGDFCHLVYAPEILVHMILSNMSNEGWALKKLLGFLKDDFLVREFEKQKGVEKIIALLQVEEVPAEVHDFAFQVIAELLMQGKVPVEWLKSNLLSRVFSHVAGETASSNATIAACLRICLALYSQGLGEDQQFLDYEMLVAYFDAKSSSLQVREAALALFNARADKEGPPDRKILIKARDLLYVTIRELAKISADFEQQLSLFQVWLVKRLVKKFESPAKFDDPQVQRRLKELTQPDKESKWDNYTESTLVLLAGYVDTPPEEVQLSLLLLDCLTHSVRSHIQRLSGSIIEHQPFLHLCNLLVRIQVDALGILTETAPLHLALFGDRAFEEMFCACIRNLNKTCKEMRAKEEDLSKILSVHAKKIEMTLVRRPSGLPDYEEILSKTSYNDVWEAWHKEDKLKQEHMFRTHRSFVELRTQLEPQYVELLKKQRLRVMTDGTKFLKFPSKNQHSPKTVVKKRYWTVTYSPKMQALEFKDSDAKFNDFTLEINQIKNILSGHNCPHANKKHSKHCNPELALSINLTTADPEFLNLAASSALEQDHWVDGIRMLMGQSMTSESYTLELQNLLDMHLQMHLIGFEDVEFPDGPPPPVPDYYDAVISFEHSE
jgi:Pleckstrin homology domain